MFNSHRGGKPAAGRVGARSASRGGPGTGGRRGPGSRDKKYTENDNDRPGYGRRNRGGPEMFRTTCDECGNSCEVPFKPTMGKPVYCRECFDTTGPNPDRASGKSFGKKDYKSKGEKSGGYSESRPAGDSGTVSTAQYDKLNEKLDKILKLLSEKEEE